MLVAFDIDDGKAPEGSVLWRGENLYAAAEYVREVFLPTAVRNVDLAIIAASSTGFDEGRISLHAYAILDCLVPMPAIYKWLFGAKASGLPLDPRSMLTGQLFLTGRPKLWGCDDPVPDHLWAFVLPGRRQRVTDLDLNEFDSYAAETRENERRAHVDGASLGWRAVLTRCMGDGPGRLGFFDALSTALGHAARSGEPVDEIVGAMHAMVSAHPDLNPKRADEYTAAWIRKEVVNLRRNDAAREARTEADIAAVKSRLPGMRFLA